MDMVRLLLWLCLRPYRALSVLTLLLVRKGVEFTSLKKIKMAPHASTVPTMSTTAPLPPRTSTTLPKSNLETTLNFSVRFKVSDPLNHVNVSYMPNHLRSHVNMPTARVTLTATESMTIPSSLPVSVRTMHKCLGSLKVAHVPSTIGSRALLPTSSPLAHKTNSPPGSKE